MLLSRVPSSFVESRSSIAFLPFPTRPSLCTKIPDRVKVRPAFVIGVLIATWAFGCSFTGDPKNGARSGLESGGPALGCFMSAKIDCPLKCANIDFDAVCDATLGAACDGQCGADATGTCLDGCNNDCAVNCAASGDVSCDSSCDDRCGDDCDKVCAGAWSSDQCAQTCKSQCHSSCAQSCQKNTDSSCTGTCNAACNATCSVQAHVACQIKCSVDGFTTCKAKVAADCVAECSSAVMLTCTDQSADPDASAPAARAAPAGDGAKNAADELAQHGDFGSMPSRASASAERPLLLDPASSDAGAKSADDRPASSAR